MVYQMFFCLLFLWGIGLHPNWERVNHIPYKTFTNLSHSSIGNEPFNVEQTGIVEFLPLTGGFFIRINIEGSHSISIFNQKEHRILQTSMPTSFEYYPVNGLEEGAYKVKVLIDNMGTETFRISVCE